MQLSMILGAALMASTMGVPAFAQSERSGPKEKDSVQNSANMKAVAPALEKYRDGTLGDLWRRPGLTPRDRSIVTLSILIARNQANELSPQLDRALDNGVKPGELSELITHLAFYAGWGNAMSAIAAAKVVFEHRKIGTDQLPEASPKLLPLDEASEAKRAESVAASAGPISQGLVKYTGELLFKDLWLRPGLAPRDRSLVTVSSLIASGQFAQITFHLGRAMDNGLTKDEASEVITQAAFYAGWPNAFSAVPVFKSVFEGRAK